MNEPSRLRNSVRLRRIAFGIVVLGVLVVSLVTVAASLVMEEGSPNPGCAGSTSGACLVRMQTNGPVLH